MPGEAGDGESGGGDGSLLPEDGIRVSGASELGAVTWVELYSRATEVGYDFFGQRGERV